MQCTTDGMARRLAGDGDVKEKVRKSDASSPSVAFFHPFLRPGSGNPLGQKLSTNIYARSLKDILCQDGSTSLFSLFCHFRTFRLTWILTDTWPILALAEEEGVDWGTSIILEFSQWAFHYFGQDLFKELGGGRESVVSRVGHCGSLSALRELCLQEQNFVAQLTVLHVWSTSSQAQSARQIPSQSQWPSIQAVSMAFSEQFVGAQLLLLESSAVLTTDCIIFPLHPLTFLLHHFAAKAKSKSSPMVGFSKAVSGSSTISPSTIISRTSKFLFHAYIALHDSLTPLPVESPPSIGLISTRSPPDIGANMKNHA
ncbi:hypothetical protein AC578_9085 [Pseudocercospora eumusae]|uniref:Uncharacterized protein n=1 Tax=Pseudocercospora eumusae TaxID=321146 RepID=A0A139GTY3_9PEZI|nr:hypothetical protein AC578_9085 [Pseudocercospora eumusae]KXS93643.1 hypothetical protein AC578_9085 [Pseudocercospora eumusae]KXS93644.1 hypothetical protein AC578_9085 [Pseudocercospora eumusae]